MGRLEPPFRLAKLEGDAAFLFVEDGRAGPLRSSSTRSRPATSHSAGACGASTRRPRATAARAGSPEARPQVLRPSRGVRPDAHRRPRRARRPGRDPRAPAPQGDDGSGDVRRGSCSSPCGGLERSVSIRRGWAWSARETVEHLGTSRPGRPTSTHAGRRRRAMRRLETDRGAGVAWNWSCTVAAAPADAWAVLTSPALRAGWEGRDRDRGRSWGRACPRLGRHDALRERVAWRRSRRSSTGSPTSTSAGELPSPDWVRSRRSRTSRVSKGAGTRLRLRWPSTAQPAVDEAAVRRIRADRRGFGRGRERAALARLERVTA